MSSIPYKSGATDSFTDVRGLRVGQAECEKTKTGVTVIIPDEAVAAGVDVRGGGPGTRDTDALDPTCLVEKIHGIVLSGGSVFGLSSADMVTKCLSEDGVGLPFGPRPVPVVPSAILFDLANGGDKNWGLETPYGGLARLAYERKSVKMTSGRVGAGYGALAGAQPGGVGTASLMTEDGLVVSALIAVNCFGAVLPEPNKLNDRLDFPKVGLVGGNTTIGVIATNAVLDKAGCKRVAIMAQDGLARTIKPIHTPFDGDTLFALATGAHDSAYDKSMALTIIGALAADCAARAVLKVIAA